MGEPGVRENREDREWWERWEDELMRMRMMGGWEIWEL